MLTVYDDSRPLELKVGIMDLNVDPVEFKVGSFQIIDTVGGPRIYEYR